MEVASLSTLIHRTVTIDNDTSEEHIRAGYRIIYSMWIVLSIEIQIYNTYLFLILTDNNSLTLLVYPPWTCEGENKKFAKVYWFISTTGKGRMAYEAGK